MSKAEPSDNELKAEIMYRLLRKGCWGKVWFWESPMHDNGTRNLVEFLRTLM